jgi:hypothetical protein
MCLVDSDCAGGYCNAGLCETGTCMDGILNQNEGDEDCGGVCPDCTQGQSCNNASDCDTGNCADGVCCDASCTGGCVSCLGASTGGLDGECDFIPWGDDPDLECGAPLSCDGAGICSDGDFEPVPPGTGCPPACTGGCAAGVCTILCDQTDECRGTSVTLNCPADMACDVRCTGEDSCHDATINCPDNYACNIVCSENSGAFDACQDAVINCSSSGRCVLDCGPADEACQRTELHCGNNGCAATCAVVGNNEPIVTCGGSCNCVEC